MENDFAKQILLKNGFNLISGNLYSFKNNNGQAMVQLEKDWVRANFIQSDGCKDIIFFEPGQENDLLMWCNYYKSNKISPIYGACGFIRT